MNCHHKLVVIILIGWTSVTICSESDDCHNLNEHIKPCECVDSPKPYYYNIFCIGKQINNSIIDRFEPLKFNLNFHVLYIHNTSIEKILGNNFEAFKFEQIFIEDNSNLHTINATAFNQSSVRHLVIRNNVKLDQQVFELVRALSPTDTIELEGNDLTEIPKDAFGLNHISAKYIQLNNNNIKFIDGLNTFKNLPNLIQLSLDHNNITDLNGFEFYSNGSQHNIEVFLNNNNLNQNLKTFKIKTGNNVNIKLYLEDNKFEKIPKVFEDFLKNDKNELYFGKNTFKCGCDMKWVLQYSKNVFNVWCSEFESQFIEKSLFNVEEMNKCK